MAHKHKLYTHELRIKLFINQNIQLKLRNKKASHLVAPMSAIIPSSVWMMSFTTEVNAHRTRRLLVSLCAKRMLRDIYSERMTSLNFTATSKLLITRVLCLSEVPSFSLV